MLLRCSPNALWTPEATTPDQQQQTELMCMALLAHSYTRVSVCVRIYDTYTYACTCACTRWEHRPHRVTHGFRHASLGLSIYLRYERFATCFPARRTNAAPNNRTTGTPFYPFLCCVYIVSYVCAKLAVLTRVGTNPKSQIPNSGFHIQTCFIIFSFQLLFAGRKKKNEAGCEQTNQMDTPRQIKHYHFTKKKKRSTPTCTCTETWEDPKPQNLKT